MPMLTDELKAHPIHESLASLEEAIRREDIKLADSADHDRLDSIKTAAEYVCQRLKHASPLLLNAKALDALDKQVVKIRDEFNTFVSNGDRAHFENALATVETVVGQARNNIVVFQSSEEVGPSISEEVARFREGGRLLLNELREKQTELSSRADGLKNSIAELEGRINGVKNTIDQHVKQFDETINQQKTRIDQMISDFQNQFSSAENNSTITYSSNG